MKLPRTFIKRVISVSLLCVILLIIPTSCSCNSSSSKPQNGGWDPGGIGIKSPRIAFVSDYEGQNEVYVMNIDGSVITKLTDSTRNSWIHSVSWSPDGTKITFIRYTDLWMMDADGENEIEIVNGPLPLNQPVSWSPDNNRIVFQHGSSTWIWNIDSKDFVYIDPDRGVYKYPDWSPDGSKIAVVSSNYDDICVINPDGSNENNLTNNLINYTEDSVFPKWSPDGSKIAYASEAKIGYTSVGELTVIDSDGLNRIILTTTNDHPMDGASISWSPDGTKIIFVTTDDIQEDIYVINADGTNLTNLTDNTGSDLYPSWSPSGTKIAFQSDRDGDEAIYVMDTDGTNQIKIADGWNPVWAP